jgi:drug/metabolite transporter (DMT)-like permease
MAWYLFALGSAFLVATYQALVKKFLKNINQHVLACGAFFSTAIILLIASLIKGIPSLGDSFYSAIVATVLLNVAATILLFKAFKLTDLSLVAPITSLTPIFLIITSFIILREVPTLIGTAGIFLIVIGAYVLNISKGNLSLFDPIKRMFKEKGIIFALIVAFLFSISSNFDKMIVQNSDTLFGSAIVNGLLGLSFLIIALFRTAGVKQVFQSHYPKFFLVGLVAAGSTIFINIAFSLQIVPYVISLKRMSILFSVMYGGILFKEKNIAMRVFGALVILAGVIFIVVF